MTARLWSLDFSEFANEKVVRKQLIQMEPRNTEQNCDMKAYMRWFYNMTSHTNHWRITVMAHTFHTRRKSFIQLFLHSRYTHPIAQLSFNSLFDLWYWFSLVFSADVCFRLDTRHVARISSSQNATGRDEFSIKKLSRIRSENTLALVKR